MANDVKFKEQRLWKQVKYSLLGLCCFGMGIQEAAAQTIEIGLAAMNVDGSLPSVTQIQSFEQKLQKPLATVGWFMGFNTETSEYANFPLEELNALLSSVEAEGQSLIPMMTLEPWGRPLDGKADAKCSMYAINAGMTDDYLTRLARDMKAFDRPIRLRFAHEMIQNDVPYSEDDHPGWYPWQDCPNDYVAAFKRVHQIFQKEGANKVEFVWAPNFHMYDYTILQKYYPGPKYVDWIGLDGYNWSGHDFDGIFRYIYLAVTGHPEIFGDKPVMLSEFAMAANLSSKQTKAEWIREAFTKMKTDYPKVRAFYWFELNKEHDWRLQSSAEAWTAFQEAMQDKIYISR